MPTDEFNKAKEKWLLEKKKYDEAVKLYESVFTILEYQQKELDSAFAEFSIQQSLQVQRAKNIKPVKGE